MLIRPRYSTLECPLVYSIYLYCFMELNQIITNQKKEAHRDLFCPWGMSKIWKSKHTLWHSKSGQVRSEWAINLLNEFACKMSANSTKTATLWGSGYE